MLTYADVCVWLKGDDKMRAAVLSKLPQLARERLAVREPL